MVPRRLVAAILAAAFIAASTPSRADVAQLTYRRAGSGDGRTLTFEPCRDPEVLRFIYPRDREKFKAGYTVFNWRTYSLCWTRVRGNRAFILEGNGIAPSLQDLSDFYIDKGV